MFCHACRSHVTPIAPRTIWKVLTVALWAVTMPVALVFSLIIGLNVVLAPAAIFLGMAIGTAARRVGSWTCPCCHAEMLEPEPQTTLSAPVTSVVALANAH